VSSFDATRHPAEFELAEHLDGTAEPDRAADIASHVSACPACARMLDLAGPVSTTPARPLATEDAAIDLAKTATVPDSLLEALRSRRVASPAVGQIWRLRAPSIETGGQHSRLVVVLQADDDVLVAPVTPDPQNQTDLWTLQVPLTNTEVTLAAWISLEASVGWEVLDVLVAETPAEPLMTVHTALRRGQEPPPGLTLGRGLDDELGRRREALRDELADFATARLWDDDDVDEYTATATAGHALKNAGLGVSDVKALLGLTARDARRVLEDALPLRGAQLGLLSDATGMPVRNGSDVVAPGWVRALANPELRPDFDDIADAMGRDAWQLRADQVALQPAARGSQGQDADYAALARDRIRVLRADAGLD
jgi:hypothetical protein